MFYKWIECSRKSYTVLNLCEALNQLYKKCLKWCSNDKNNRAGLQIDKITKQRVTVNEIINQLTFLMTQSLAMIYFFSNASNIVTIQKSIVFRWLFQLLIGARQKYKWGHQNNDGYVNEYLFPIKLVNLTIKPGNEWTKLLPHHWKKTKTCQNILQ